jgi:hypothetical protein
MIISALEHFKDALRALGTAVTHQIPQLLTVRGKALICFIKILYDSTPWVSRSTIIAMSMPNNNQYNFNFIKVVYDSMQWVTRSTI